MYIRTREDAIENLAQILELPDRRDQIIQSTVRIMLCLEVEPRLFLADCQALLIEGGLDALRERRRLLVEAAENLTIGFIDDSEDRLFEDVASALDALRFVEVVRQVFPGLHADRWQVARLILLYESGVREQINEAVRSHGDPAHAERGPPPRLERPPGRDPERLHRDAEGDGEHRRRSGAPGGRNALRAFRDVERSGAGAAGGARQR